MSFKNFFARSIRGWLPEEPKMPKSKLKRYRAPIAVLVAATTIVTLFSSSFFVANQTAALLSPPMIVPSAPNSSYVELGGVEPANSSSSFILVLTNGNHIFPKNFTLTFSITEKSGNKCTVRFAVECDGFSNEAAVDGSIVDGNLIIDSRRSIFLINPNVTGKNVVLTETDNWKLSATVDSTAGKVSTAIDPYGVTAVKVSSPASRTEKGWPLGLRLGYDPTTGILVYSAFSISDVLLEKLGIDLLIGGLKLVSYSENLNLEVVNLPPPGLMSSVWFVLVTLLVSSPVIVPVVAVVVYILRKRRKRRQAGAHNILELHDNTGQSCEVGD